MDGTTARGARMRVVPVMLIALSLLNLQRVAAQGPQLPSPGPEVVRLPPPDVPGKRALPPAPPPPDPASKQLPVNLPTALQLAGVRPVDIAAATQRLGVAVAQYRQASVLWIPSITQGMDYFRHDGGIQDVQGNIINTSKQSLMYGLGSGMGSSAIISSNDAYFAPLAARQVVKAREADVRAAANDAMVAVTDAYFNVQQARGELAGAIDAVRRARELVRRTKLLAEGLIPPLEVLRAQAELARREQTELLARERWRVASAELTRVLRIAYGGIIDPVEPPDLRVDLLSVDGNVDDLIPVGLLNRPELASQHRLVEATLQLLKQEQMRPLMPSLLVRGASTTVTGTLAAGVFGGGLNGAMGSAQGREDIDVQVLWQLDNMGFGNRAKIQQRRSENQGAIVEALRTQDRIAAEVTQAFAQAQLAAGRVKLAEQELTFAIGSAAKNLAGIEQTRRQGEMVILVVRPQEVVQSIQALAQAYVDYYGAINDSNRAQFRLYRALGQPAALLLPTAPLPGPSTAPPAAPVELPPSAPPLLGPPPQHPGTLANH